MQTKPVVVLPIVAFCVVLVAGIVRIFLKKKTRVRAAVRVLIVLLTVQSVANIFLYEGNLFSDNNNPNTTVTDGHSNVILNPSLPQLSHDRLHLQQMPDNMENALDLLAAGYNITNNDDPRLRPTFVQIGANDGQMFDPLYQPMLTRHHLWNGLLVEPQPKLFEKLVSLHRDKVTQWGFYNGIVSSACRDGKVVFCESVASGGNTTNWREQGQGNSVGMKHCQNYERGKGLHFVRTERSCVQDVKELVEKHSPVVGENSVPLLQPDRIDLLQIDTEGHDFEIIKGMFNDDRIILHPPRCIHYEATFPGVRRDSVPYLESKGYTVKKSTRDDLLACRLS